MSEDRIFPKKLAEFNQYLKNAVPWLLANVVRLGISTANKDLLKSLYTDGALNWETVYPLTTDSTTSTKKLRDDRDLLRGKIETQMRTIFDDIPKSALTNEDRNKLRLKERDAVPTRAGVMGHAPDVDMENIEHLQHTLRFGDPENPESQEMPDKQKIILEYFIGNAGLADDAITFGNTKTVTRFLYDVRFADADVRKTVYYRCCYENTRGERGIWSTTLSAVVA